MRITKALLVKASMLAMAAATPGTALAQSSAELLQRINELQAQLVTLQSQVASQQAETQAAQSQAAAAQASAEAATKASKENKSVLSKNASWVERTKISGRMYFNISNIDQEDNAPLSAASTSGRKGTGFNIKRFYLGVDHKFDDMFAGNVTMDVSNVLGNTSTGNNVSSSTPTSLVGKGFYIKKAYLQAKFDPAFVVRVGASDMPWIPYAESIYGYRHIENTVSDRLSIGTSADWGVHVSGEVADGLLAYQFSAINGAGYRNVKVTKAIDLEGRINLKYQGFVAGIGGYTGKRGQKTEHLVAGQVDPRTASRFNALIGYKSDLFTIGGEYFAAKNWSNSNISPILQALEDKSRGYSLFASVNFADKWSAFARHDWVKNSRLVNPELRDRYFNVGIQYSPAKIVDLALVYKRDRSRGGAVSTSNGTIGSNSALVLPEDRRGSYDEIGLFGQFRF